MNILELCLSGGFGGLEIYVFRAAQALDKDNNVLAVLDKPSKLAEHFKDNAEINTVYLSYSRSYLPLINARRLAGIIDNHDIDVIHIHWGNDLPLAAFAKKFSEKKPALIYTRQMQITRSKDDFYHNFLYRQMDLMLTITRRLETDARRFIKRYADKIRTLYYGVSAPDHLLSNDERNRQRAEAGFKADDFIVGLIGRLEQSKGQHLLISAIAGAKNKGSNIHALIVGHEMNQGYRNTLKQLAADNGIAENIAFMDFVPDPQRIMQLCDCIVLATYEETFGLVLPEAMRAGVAVIGSNSGGVPEIIKHDETGLLFDSGDTNSLCEQIMKLATDPEKRSKIAANGKQDADSRFNTDDHFSQLQQLLSSATNRPKTG